ncbi:unnamed protein product, partial [Mesorhabditis spiculigera]
MLAITLTCFFPLTLTLHMAACATTRTKNELNKGTAPPRKRLLSKSLSDDSTQRDSTPPKIRLVSPVGKESMENFQNKLKDLRRGKSRGGETSGRTMIDDDDSTLCKVPSLDRSAIHSLTTQIELPTADTFAP